MIERFRTRYGTVFHSSTCKDDWPNLATVTLVNNVVTRRKQEGATYTLQSPAIKSLRAVARDLGGPWRPQPVRVTGTIRACETQAALYASDSSRYAHPNVTLHTQGLAIDVNTNFLDERIRKSLLAHGWHQSRPDDEPWHFSYKLTA
jgi:hypothetical protein